MITHIQNVNILGEGGRLEWVEMIDEIIIDQDEDSGRSKHEIGTQRRVSYDFISTPVYSYPYNLYTIHKMNVLSDFLRIECLVIAM